MPAKCPICLGTTKPYDERANTIPIACENCGDFYTTHELATDFRNASPEDRTHLSGWIRDRWRRGDRNIILMSHNIEPILKGVPRLGPVQKANNFLLTLARMSGQPGKEIAESEVRPSDAWAMDRNELNVYVYWLREREFLYTTPGKPQTGYRLTLNGWVETDRLERERATNSTHAFMAMQFGDARLDALVRDHFVPAVQATGFDLRRLSDGQPAGLIDDQLRVRLRTARFIVADLTHGNQGAYWEAGFAEGLGTPVIYTCEKTVFQSPDRKKATHFDTNHLVTVLWEEQSPEVAANQLKAHIRATLPYEANLEN